MADLTAPQAGLRPPGVRLFNKSNGTAKVSLHVPQGSELEVDDDVARQLLAMGAFAAVADASPADTTPVGPVVEEAGGGSARRAGGRRRG
jgi:hypothetical protein